MQKVIKKRRPDIKNLVGQRFNKLMVISLSDFRTNSGSVLWNCKCDCGKNITVSKLNLTTGNSKSCGCLRIKMCKKRTLPNGESAFNALFSFYKISAKKRKMIFSLDKKDFKNLVIKNCNYCGRSPSNIINNKKSQFIYNGIDRINNNMGYFLENCTTCCKNCNFFKSKLTVEEFLNHVKCIIDYQVQIIYNRQEEKEC